MSEALALHDRSMDQAELAVLARLRGDQQEATRLFREALDLELQAIARLSESPPSEPTHSVLHRSAAALALDCDDWKLAERLVGKALANNPPAVIAEELRELLEQVHVRRQQAPQAAASESLALSVDLARRALRSLQELATGQTVDMLKTTGMLKTIGMEDTTLDRCIDEAQHDLVGVTRGGVPIAVVVALGSTREHGMLPRSGDGLRRFMPRPRQSTVSRAE